MERIDLKKIIAESREIAEALDEFADKLEKLEKKYAEGTKSTERAKSATDPLKYLNNGIPHFMEELTEELTDAEFDKTKKEA